MASSGKQFSFDDLQRRLDEKVTGVDLKQVELNRKAQDGLIEQIQGTIDKHGKFVVDVAIGLGANPDEIKKTSRPEAFLSCLRGRRRLH